ncbi:MAG: mechanosensitive ion channel [Candidatus Omnitrophica bacterium]|nr:mechanosensitive ion channel [Candidatus Omnitrophota bacterium]
MEATLQKIYVYVLPYAINIFAAILIFFIGKWVARIAARFVETALNKSKLDKTLAAFTKNIVYYLIIIFVVIAALGKLGVQTSSFVALVGAAGLAVGFALQGSLANFAAGVMIIIFEPFKAGDLIEAGGATGVVEEIQIFNTIFSAADKKTVIMPNSKITNDKIIIHQRRGAK